MPKSVPSARAVAVTLLDGVLGEGRLLSDMSRELAALSPQDRAIAQRLCAQTLRGLERADRVLKPHLRKTPPLRVRNVLRLATVELCLGGAAHAVVNEAVALMQSGRKTQGFKGLVNAVLRKVAARGPDEWQKLRVPRLPRWLRDPLVEAWGRDSVAQIEASHFNTPPIDLTAKGDPRAVADATGGTLLPTGSVRLHQPGQITALPGYEAGDWWVQDAAAALPVRLLGDLTGQTVLDICAAPGGKTMQLAAAGAEVTAVDLSEHRLARIAENLARTGLSATLVAGDALEQSGLFDAVVLDAPCSATGTIRRHPDLPHARSGDGIGDLIDLQAQMIDHAVTLVKPGGRLLFCTCSLLPDEGECQIEEALTRHPGLSIEPLEADGLEPAWRSDEGGLRLRPDMWPEAGGLDGFYMAVLRKA